jgi:glycosyltransferase involved in cell wall biosynthesis
MRIIHLSYARVPAYDHPQRWLAQLPFFTVMLETTARFAEVKSIHLINYEGVHEYNGVEYHFLRKRRWQVQFPFKIHRYVKSLAPDVIMVHGLIFPWQVLWLRFQIPRPVKLILVHHAERPLRFHKKILQRYADSLIDAYLFTSRRLGRSWTNSGLIDNPAKIHEVMIGSSVFFPIDRTYAMSKTGIPGAGVYLWVGALNSNKDPITLISAFKLMLKTQPDKKLYLIFQGSELIETVKGLLVGCSQIILIGKIRHELLLYWYNSADFIISSSHYEGGGTAVCEGLSCGCVPIVTNIPSFRMMTDEGRVGLLFNAGNVHDLHQALLKTTSMNISEERKKVLDRFENALSNDAIVDKMLAVCKSIR